MFYNEHITSLDCRGYEMDGITLFNSKIKEHIINNKKYLKGRSTYLPTFMNLSKHILKKEHIRSQYLEKESLFVPAILIITVTNRCNLNCVDCYANAQDRDFDDEMDIQTIAQLIKDAHSLGVSFILLAGGEPLMKKGLLDVIDSHKDMLFLLFTNGTLLNKATLNRMTKMKHLVPAISMEGDQIATDSRRSHGMYDQIIKKYQEMDALKMLYGTSITLTKQNYDHVISSEFLKALEANGCRVLVLIEYVPCNGDLDRCLTSLQKKDLIKQIDVIRKTMSILPIALPGDESQFGGCLASGRGFLHISSTGHIEACPFAPYSDTNVKDMPLKEALQSRLLQGIRNNHHLLEESEGGCTLYENPDFIESLREKV